MAAEQDSAPVPTRVCGRCGKRKPETSFNRNRPGGPCRATCRACQKAARRRRDAIPTREEITARADAKRAARLRRTLTRLLRALLTQRCEAEGICLRTPVYRARYRADEAFRQREIARTWQRKAASGVLRTDGRTAVHVHDDGTLTSDVVQRLFAEATDCPYCGEWMHPRVRTLDHVVPVSRGGVHGIGNVVVCCRPCNTRKGARTPQEARDECPHEGTGPFRASCEGNAPAREFGSCSISPGHFRFR